MNRRGFFGIVVGAGIAVDCSDQLKEMDDRIVEEARQRLGNRCGKAGVDQFVKDIGLSENQFKSIRKDISFKDWNKFNGYEVNGIDLSECVFKAYRG